MNSQSIKGYTLGVIAAATYGMNPLFALPLYARGMDSNSVLLFRYLTAIPIIALMIKWRGRDFKLQRREILPVMVLGLLMGFSSLALFESYNFMEAGIASTMLFVYPLMVALIMSMLFHEKLTLMTVICLITACAGIVLLYNGKPGSTLSVAGTAWVMGSALSYAIYIVGVNKSIVGAMPPLKLTFYSLVAGALIFVLNACIRQSVTVPHNALMWGDIIGLGVLPTAVSLVCTTVAIRLIGSTPTAILGVFEPATALIFGVVVFHEALTMRDVAGLALILVAVSLVIAGGNIVRPIIALRRMFPSLRKK